MGFTRNWVRRPANEPAGAFDALAADARLIVEACNANGVVLAGPVGTGPVIIDDERIAFNGVPGFETFTFRRDVSAPDPVAARLAEMGLYEPGERPAFTKTQRQPYDVAVVAVLLRAAAHYGASFSTDGTIEPHPGALKLCAMLFP